MSGGDDGERDDMKRKLTPYERITANEPPGFRQRPKPSHIWWCFDDQRGCETLNGHEGHDLVRIGPKAPLPEEKKQEPSP